LAQNLMLAAWTHGVGSCIGSLYPEQNQAAARELLGIPPERHLRTILSLGYPAPGATAPVGSRGGIQLGRKPLGEFVSWERYGVRQRRGVNA
jgi:nitroreductase